MSERHTHTQICCEIGCHTKKWEDGREILFEGIRDNVKREIV
jgi:hypothetical protein